MLRNTGDGNELALPLPMPSKSIVLVEYTVMASRAEPVSVPRTRLGAALASRHVEWCGALVCHLPFGGRARWHTAPQKAIHRLYLHVS